MKKSSENNYKLFKKGDIILVAVFIALIVLTIVFSTAGKTSSEAIVYVDGEIYQYLDLTKDGEYEILDGDMTIKVNNGYVSVSHSNCKEQICVHSSAISKDGGMIVCLPNKVMIKISSKEVDAIT